MIEQYSLQRLRNLINEAAERSSYTKLAKQTGLCPATLWRIGHGKQDPKVSQAHKIVCAIEELKQKSA